MIIVKPSACLLWTTGGAAQVIEAAGRTCYKSEDKIGPGTAAKFIDMLFKRGHLSVLEHASASFRIVCDRGVTHEIVRHRIASYSQESTRYCNYGKEKHGGQISVVQPPGLTDRQRYEWQVAMSAAETAYLAMLANGCTPQIARSVLPTCLKTEIVMTANFREWLHFISLRTSPAAHPQMREVAEEIRDALKVACPEVFHGA